MVSISASTKVSSGAWWAPAVPGRAPLLNILGLLDRPSSGTVEILGQDCRSWTIPDSPGCGGAASASCSSFITCSPPSPRGERLPPPMLADVGHFEPEMRRRARGLLASVGLPRASRPRLATKLSGGQQQRVAITRALVMNPALVLADEPTGNLDQASGQQAFELMRRFDRDSGTAFLLVTHEPALGPTLRSHRHARGRLYREQGLRPAERVRRIRHLQRRVLRRASRTAFTRSERGEREGLRRSYYLRCGVAPG